METTATNFDQAELAKFSVLAHRWWDPNSEFKPLHDINPLRLDYIEGLAGGISGKRIIDVGCGGGILAEAMARRGATVTGLDLSDKALKVAQLHALEAGITVTYRLEDVARVAAEEAGGFDVVTCMEMLEHVPDPALTINACAALLRPGGLAVFSTINRNPKSYLFAVIGAEYVLRLLPRGTHDYARFIRPSELCRYARDAGLPTTAMIGMTYNPLTRAYRLEPDTSVNYIVACRKAEAP
ncbi:MAG: bifunctional 2-polyprenyl-6-hydroxyphenol methylase/3-demethylubiquinol 3-O-methyltransferase UbiG [Casimicrobiaceae bacterium]